MNTIILTIPQIQAIIFLLDEAPERNINKL